MDIRGLIAADESQVLEKKSSFRWDFDLDKMNKDLTKVVAKTMAGFLNAQGGTLLIGVDDQHNVVGIEKDLDTLSRKDTDRYEQTLRSALAKHLGPDVSPRIGIEFQTVDDQRVTVVTCAAHEDPVFFHDGDKREFYVRDGNTTQPFDPKAAHEYIRVNWHLKKQEDGGVEAVAQELLTALPSREDIRQVIGEVLAGYVIPNKALPAPGTGLPTWIRVRTVRALDLFLAALARAEEWRKVYIVSPWISSIDSPALPTATMLKKLAENQATAYVITRPPVEEYHLKAIQAFGDSGRSNVAFLPELHMKLFVAVTTETTFAMLGSANFTAGSLMNREIGVLVSSSGDGKAIVRQLKYEAAEVYRASARPLVHKAEFRAR